MPRNFYEMLQKQPSDKTALIEDDVIYTYGDLIKQAERGCVTREDLEVQIIKGDTPARDLITFLQVQKNGKIPVLIPGDEKRTFQMGAVPEKEEVSFGVATSGSTGAPKIYYRTFASWFDFFTVQNTIFDITQDTVLFAQGPLSFTGNLNIYMGVLSAGATIVTCSRFAPKEWMQQLERYNCNAIYMIPDKLRALMRVGEQSIPGIETIVSGSQSLGIADVEELKKRFPSCEVTLYYGSSEASYISYLRGREMTADKKGVGKCFPGIDITIQDDEIYVNTPYMILGENCPFATKDCGYMDAEGNLFLLGRKDDIVLLHGRKISLMRIEEHLRKLPGVLAAAVSFNEEDGIIAVVEMEPENYHEEKMKSSLRETLAGYEMPKKIQRIDKIQRLSSGKVRR